MYSLSSPRLTGKTVPRGERELEAFCDFCLDEDGCTLVALVCVLFVNCSVMLLRVIATFDDAGEQLSQLAESVTRVVNMRL